MNSIQKTTLLSVVIFTAAALPAFGQFPLKLPRIPKVKTEATPTPAGNPITISSSESKRPPGRATNRGSDGPYLVRPVPPSDPLFLADTLEVTVRKWDYYWKIPNNNHHTSWVPDIRSRAYYGGGSKQRFKAEYFMPDGSPWFSEVLEFRESYSPSEGLASISSPNDSGRDQKAIVTGGTFGLKIINIRDNSTVFEGKFTVVRHKPSTTDSRYKDEVEYYVDHDWRLLFGYAEPQWVNDDRAMPAIKMWFKGDLKSDSFEARLSRNGQQIASTDDAAGGVNTGERYWAGTGHDAALFWKEVKFSWLDRIEFRVKSNDPYYTGSPTAKWLNQMPGDYTVKIFYNGEQVREASFRVDDGGSWENGIAKLNGISTNKLVVPVKVIGTLDKWNPVKAKTMGFYGKPIQGVQ